MKIALVSPYDYAYTSGVNNHISRLRDHFRRMGHDVKIIAPSSRPQETQKDGDVIVFGRPIPIRASGSVVRSPVSPGLVFGDDVKDTLRRERFDILHIHEPLMPTLATAVLHHASQELVVGTFHAFRNRSWGYSFWKPICLNRWFNKLDGRITVSEAARAFVSKYFPAEYELIPNGIDLQHFATQVGPLPQFSDGKLNILFVGRMEKRKGFKYLLEAFGLVKRAFPECRLIVVGPEGRASLKYKKLAEKRNLQDVVFAGFVPYDELPRYYHSADIFCSPATDKESFGLVLLEAMAAAKPTVATNIEGYACVVGDGADGLLVEPRNPGALADGLLRLLDDRPLREKMGATGALKAKDYSWETVAERVMAYYEKLLRGHGHPVTEEVAGAQQGSTRLGSTC